MREQQRSQKISLQIEHLRDLLTNANVPFKPDKFSTLITVVDYIKQLQRRSAVLDAEQKKLIDTISKTNQVVNDSHLPLSARSTSSMSDETTSASNSARSSGAPTSGISSMLCMSSDPITAGTPQDVTSCGGRQIGRSGENETSRPGGDMAFIQSVDYRTIFFKTVLPLAVASIDGRFIDCNPEFERLSGYTRSELLPALLESRNVSLDGSVGIIDGFHGSAIGHNYLTVPDVTTSSHIDGTAAAGPPHVKASDDSDPFAVNSTACNMSLFNVLCRENMEEVFVVLSEMLKYVPTNDEGVLQTTTPPTSRNDYWSGAVRLNRNPGLEVSLSRNIVLE
jgi:PAS domain-containing protein